METNDGKCMRQPNETISTFELINKQNKAESAKENFMSFMDAVWPQVAAYYFQVQKEIAAAIQSYFNRKSNSSLTDQPDTDANQEIKRPTDDVRQNDRDTRYDSCSSLSRQLDRRKLCPSCDDDSAAGGDKIVANNNNKDLHHEKSTPILAHRHTNFPGILYTDSPEIIPHEIRHVITDAEIQMRQTLTTCFGKISKSFTSSYPKIRFMINKTYPQIRHTVSCSYPNIQYTINNAYDKVQGTVKSSYPKIRKTVSNSYPKRQTISNCYRKFRHFAIKHLYTKRSQQNQSSIAENNQLKDSTMKALSYANIEMAGKLSEANGEISQAIHIASKKVSIALGTANLEILQSLKNASGRVSKSLIKANSEILEALTNTNDELRKSLASAHTEAFRSLENVRLELSKSLEISYPQILQKALQAYDSVKTGLEQSHVDLLETLSKASSDVCEQISNAHSKYSEAKVNVNYELSLALAKANSQVLQVLIGANSRVGGILEKNCEKINHMTVSFNTVGTGTGTSTGSGLNINPDALEHKIWKVIEKGETEVWKVAENACFTIETAVENTDSRLWKIADDADNNLKKTVELVEQKLWNVIRASEYRLKSCTEKQECSVIECVGQFNETVWKCITKHHTDNCPPKRFSSREFSTAKYQQQQQQKSSYENHMQAEEIPDPADLKMGLIGSPEVQVKGSLQVVVSYNNNKYFVDFPKDSEEDIESILKLPSTEMDTDMNYHNSKTNQNNSSRITPTPRHMNIVSNRGTKCGNEKKQAHYLCPYKNIADSTWNPDSKLIQELELSASNFSKDTKRDQTFQGSGGGYIVDARVFGISSSVNYCRARLDIANDLQDQITKANVIVTHIKEEISNVISKELHVLSNELSPNQVGGSQIEILQTQSPLHLALTNYNPSSNSSTCSTSISTLESVASTSTSPNNVINCHKEKSLEEIKLNPEVNVFQNPSNASRCSSADISEYAQVYPLISECVNWNKETNDTTMDASEKTVTANTTVPSDASSFKSDDSICASISQSGTEKNSADANSNKNVKQISELELKLTASISKSNTENKIPKLSQNTKSALSGKQSSNQLTFKNQGVPQKLSPWASKVWASSLRLESEREQQKPENTGLNLYLDIPKQSEIEIQTQTPWTESTEVQNLSDSGSAKQEKSTLTCLAEIDIDKVISSSATFLCDQVDQDVENMFVPRSISVPCIPQHWLDQRKSQIDEDECTEDEVSPSPPPPDSSCCSCYAKPSEIISRNKIENFQSQQAMCYCCLKSNLEPLNISELDCATRTGVEIIEKAASQERRPNSRSSAETLMSPVSTPGLAHKIPADNVQKKYRVTMEDTDLIVLKEPKKPCYISSVVEDESSSDWENENIFRVGSQDCWKNHMQQLQTIMGAYDVIPNKVVHGKADTIELLKNKAVEKVPRTKGEEIRSVSLDLLSQETESDRTCNFETPSVSSELSDTPFEFEDADQLSESSFNLENYESPNSLSDTDETKNPNAEKEVIDSAAASRSSSPTRRPTTVVLDKPSSTLLMSELNSKNKYPDNISSISSTQTPSTLSIAQISEKFQENLRQIKMLLSVTQMTKNAGDANLAEFDKNNSEENDKNGNEEQNNAWFSPTWDEISKEQVKKLLTDCQSAWDIMANIYQNNFNLKNLSAPKPKKIFPNTESTIIDTDKARNYCLDCDSISNSVSVQPLTFKFQEPKPRKGDNNYNSYATPPASCASYNMSCINMDYSCRPRSGNELTSNDNAFKKFQFSGDTLLIETEKEAANLNYELQHRSDREIFIEEVKSGLNVEINLEYTKHLVISDDKADRDMLLTNTFGFGLEQNFGSLTEIGTKNSVGDCDYCNRNANEAAQGQEQQKYEIQDETPVAEISMNVPFQENLSHCNNYCICLKSASTVSTASTKSSNSSHQHNNVDDNDEEDYFGDLNFPYYSYETSEPVPNFPNAVPKIARTKMKETISNFMDLTTILFYEASKQAQQEKGPRELQDSNPNSDESIQQQLESKHKYSQSLTTNEQNCINNDTEGEIFKKRSSSGEIDRHCTHKLTVTADTAVNVKKSTLNSKKHPFLHNTRNVVKGKTRKYSSWSWTMNLFKKLFPNPKTRQKHYFLNSFKVRLKNCCSSSCQRERQCQKNKNKNLSRNNKKVKLRVQNQDTLETNNNNIKTSTHLKVSTYR